MIVLEDHLERIETLSADTFSPHVGTRFRLEVDGQTLTLDLTEVSLLPGDDPRSFSMVFRQQQGPCLEQDHYLLQHEVMGDAPLFLVPIRPAADGSPCYESLFNRQAG